MLTLAQVRQAIATRISGLTGWQEAPVPWDIHSVSGVPSAVPASRLNLSFAVGMPESEAIGYRHRTTVRIRSLVAVRVICALAALDALTSVDAALGAERDLIRRLDVYDGATWPGDLTLYYAGSRRSAAPTGDWLLLEVRFTVEHTLALT